MLSAHEAKVLGCYSIYYCSSRTRKRDMKCLKVSYQLSYLEAKILLLLYYFWFFQHPNHMMMMNPAMPHHRATH